MIVIARGDSLWEMRCLLKSRIALPLPWVVRWSERGDPLQQAWLESESPGCMITVLQRWRDDDHASSACEIRRRMLKQYAWVSGIDPPPILLKQIADAIRAAVPLDSVPTLAELLASEPPETWDP